MKVDQNLKQILTNKKWEIGPDNKHVEDKLIYDLVYQILTYFKEGEWDYLKMLIVPLAVSYNISN